MKVKAKLQAKAFLRLGYGFGDRVIVSLGEGKTNREVRELFHVSRQRLAYWIKKGLREGYLVKDGFKATKGIRMSIKYKLTERGRQKYLIGDEKGVSSDGSLNVRVHGALLGFPILDDSDVDLSRLDRDVKRKVELRNWCPRFSDIAGLSFRVTTKSVDVWACSFWVPSDGFKERAVLRVLSMCQDVAVVLSRKYGFKLDILNPKFIVVPQYAMPDFFSGDNEKIRVMFQGGNIDFSKGYKEFEYSDAKHLSDFLAVPERVKYLEEKQKDVATTSQLASTFEMMKELLKKKDSKFIMSS